MKKKGFTLIELLIVVAIIAILAAIAVPNFLEAQVRSKVSRTKADMRSMATALEAYYTDSNAFPQCHTFGISVKLTTDPVGSEILERLSTPIAYISNTLIKDPFTIRGRLSASTAYDLANSTPISSTSDWVAKLNTYIYQAFSDKGRAQISTDSYEPVRLTARAYILHSAGPDGLYHNLGGVLSNERLPDDCLLLMYDPTNGTVSRGSIYRSGGAPQEGSDYAGGMGLVRAIQIANH
jgi:prepilin-type N-terminal cleavage/methylation domain-containing protein